MAEQVGADPGTAKVCPRVHVPGGRWETRTERRSMIGALDFPPFHELHGRLATTPGPSLHEGPRRRCLQAFLEESGVRTRVDEAGNLWVALGPDGWDDAVVYDAHLDVVERGWVEGVEIEDGWMRGLGVGDDLTAVTMLALLARELTARGVRLSRPLRLLFSVGEEGLGNLKGVRQMVADHPRPPYLFISLDGSFERYSNRGLGSIRLRVSVSCPGGHSWHDFGTPNAIDQLVELLGVLKVRYGELASGAGEKLSYNLGTIAGGTGINSLAREAEVCFEFRSVSPDLLVRARAQVDEGVSFLAGRPDVSVSCEVIGERPAAAAVHPERVEPLVRELLSTCVEAPHCVASSTNINVPLATGWPSIAFGLCRCERGHTEEERVELSSLPLGWGVLSRLTERLVG